MHPLRSVVSRLAERPYWRPLAVFTAIALIAGATVGCGDSVAEETVAPAVLATAPAPSVKAAAGILVDRSTGRVLWKKNPNQRRAPASLTKVMTAIIVLEKVRNLDSKCTAPKAVAKDLGNSVGLRPGDRITVRQALRAAIVKSANDACVTLAYRVAGSEAAFVRLMNAKARSLGLDDTQFKNSRGRPVSGHYMSADDLARLSRYAMSNAKFRGLCKRQTAVIKWPGHAVRVESHNRLLNYDWADGIKTGATSQSGMCLLGSGKYDRRSLILVTLKQPTRNQEERDAVAMFKWGDAQYEQRLIISAGDLVTAVPLSGGGEVRAVAMTSLTKTVRRAAQVQVRVSLLAAPPLGTLPEAGTKLGSVAYKADGQNLGTVDLVADGLADPSASPSAL